ncbi:MAG TPA: hypothetical protein VFH85_03125 [Gammaproteobacteria bacterium]|nr:hypothetical protein [Gammaproteobacteria bacterium]
MRILARPLIGLLPILLLAGALTGCSTWRWHWPAWMKSSHTASQSNAEADQRMPPDSAAGILYFVAGVVNLPAAERAKAYRAAKQRYAAHRTAADRLRLALLAALLPAPEHDRRGAHALLTGYSWRTTQPGYAGLATIALDLLQRERQNERETARTHAALAGKLSESEAANTRLKKQLDELKAIEKALGSRGVKSGP